MQTRGRKFSRCKHGEKIFADTLTRFRAPVTNFIYFVCFVLSQLNLIFAMKSPVQIVFILVFILSTHNAYCQPVALHPDNPHYLIYKDRPILLVTSAEHYGAVLNSDFDYTKYLETLAREGMNYTRIFTGSYVEMPGSFGIENNTLSPKAGSFIAPWIRTDQPGLYEKEGKFDFEQSNLEYFTRIHGFMETAQRLNIIVEVTFFCATYQDEYWKRHPFHGKNNINQTGEFPRQDFNTLKNETVVKYQKKLVEKLTKELNVYDNIIFEISNEPWADNGLHTQFIHKTLIPKENTLGWLLWATAASAETMAWQTEMAKAFRTTEMDLPKKHLLAQNYSNFKENLIDLSDDIDIINFHYAWPEAVTYNYGWNKPINYDESGFAGNHDTTYLQQAWAFMLSGGAIFNNLDYSFSVGHEDGTGINNAPGGGSTNFRKQLRFLRNFLESFDFIKMKPQAHLIAHSPGLDAYCMAGKNEFAFYFNGRNQGYAKVKVPLGEYEMEIFEVDSGQKVGEQILTVKEEITVISFPKLSRIAISLKNVK